MIQLIVSIFISLHRTASPCCAADVVEPQILAQIELIADTNATPGTVQGDVKAGGQALPADIVIYLEAKDPAARFPTPPGKPRVSQKGAQFSPTLTVVCVGQTIEFVNDEDRAIEHNVFSNSPALPFDLGLFPQRESRSVTFEKPGAVVLHCSVHKYMDGAVFVSPTPFFSKVDAKGHYMISGVSPGEYTLKLWQRRPRFPEANSAVTVNSGQNVTCNVELKRK
jgi:plastocyanin